MIGLKWRAFIRLAGVSMHMGERDLVREFDKVVRAFHSSNFSYDIVLTVEPERAQRSSRSLMTTHPPGNGSKTPGEKAC